MAAGSRSESQRIFKNAKECKMKDIRGIWEFFENMREYVYAADIETYELVYMNRKALEVYGFHSMDEIKGKKCYEVLQRSSRRCSTCNNRCLCEGKFIESKYYNPILDKYVMLKETLVCEERTGRKYRVELSVDMSQEHEKDRILQKFRNMDSIVNEGLRVAFETPHPEESIDTILEYLGTFLKGERTYIFERNENGCDDNTYEWVAEGIHPEKENLQNLAPEICAQWYRQFQDGKNIVIKDLEQIREKDPLQYANLKRQNIHSLVVVPLYYNGEVIAFYGVDNPPLEALEYTSNMLQTMGHFLVSCIRRRKLNAQLVDMSYRDPLTRLGNRFAMDHYVRHMDKEASIGVIYCDITGLKQVNDTLGHQEGDKLILRAGESLRKVFEEYGVFRIGGDELLALCAGIGKEEQQRRIALLRQRMTENDVNIAIGDIWCEKADTDLDTLLMESDRRMYEEKKAYYRQKKEMQN